MVLQSVLWRSALVFNNQRINLRYKKCSKTTDEQHLWMLTMGGDEERMKRCDVSLQRLKLVGKKWDVEVWVTGTQVCSSVASDLQDMDATEYEVRDI